MTIKYFFFTIVVTFLLALSQILIKIGLTKIGGFNLQLNSFFSDILLLLKSHYLWLGVGAVILSFFLWMEVLANSKVSIAYPLISFSYVFGLMMSWLILHEKITISNWIGVIFIMVGVYFIAK